MSIDSIRFRNEGALIVLQVRETTYEEYTYSPSRTKSAWRDATTEDLLYVANYTRAHDTLTSDIASLRAELAGMREMRDTSQMGRDETWGRLA